MLETLRDIYAVVWVDLRFLSRNLGKTLALTLVAPILYLLAFGYGLGRGASIEGFSYLEFVIPGILALTAMTTAFNTSGLKLHVDRLFYKCFDETLMSPVSAFSIIIGKALIGVIRGMLSSAALLLACLVFSPLPAVSLLFPLSLVVTCFVFSFLGVIVALLAKTHRYDFVYEFGYFAYVFPEWHLLFFKPSSRSIYYPFPIASDTCMSMFASFRPWTTVSMVFSFYSDSFWSCVLYLLFCRS
jgi:hypothetical protein